MLTENSGYLKKHRGFLGVQVFAESHPLCRFIFSSADEKPRISTALERVPACAHRSQNKSRSFVGNQRYVTAYFRGQLLVVPG